MGSMSRKKTQIMGVVVLCTILLIIHAFVRFNKTLFRSELKSQQDELERTAKLGISNAQDRYSDMLESLEILADTISGSSSIYDSSVSKQIQLLKQTGYFDNVGVSDQTGNSIDSKTRKNNIADREYFKEAMKGTPTISDTLVSKLIPGKEIQVMAVPIKEDGKNKGIVFGILNLYTIHKVLGNETSGDIYVQIVDSEGDYVTRFKTQDVLMKYKNLWQDVSEYEFLEGNQKKLKQDMKNRKSGYFTFRLGKEERVSYYAPLGLKDYYIFSTINSKYLKEDTKKTRQNMLMMSLEIIAAFLILISGLYWYNKKVKEELKQSHDEALSSEEMMQIAIQQTEQIVFEYNYKTKVLRTRAGVKNILFSSDFIERVPESILNQGVIEQESLTDFRDLFDKIPELDFCEAVIKTRGERKPKWMKVMMKNLYDENHRIANTVGIVEDVSEKKYQEELLKEKQQIQDALNADAFLTCKVDLGIGRVLEEDGDILPESISYQQYLKEHIFCGMAENDRKRVISELSEENLVNEYHREKEATEVQFKMKRQSGEIWVSCMIYLMQDEQSGHIEALMIFNDIDEKKRQELSLQERAEKDGLTGLYNAATFQQKADGFLESSLWALEGSHMFLLLDLDNFKEVNDTFGHQYGDRVLKDVAEILKTKFRQNDLIGRLGGDEFVVMAFHTPGFSRMEHIFCELCEILNKTYCQDGKTVKISASLGIAIAPQHGATFEELYQKADKMLYQVKRNQKNGYAVYEDER